jgi:hypothetical protein
MRFVDDARKEDYQVVGRYIVGTIPVRQCKEGMLVKVKQQDRCMV